MTLLDKVKDYGWQQGFGVVLLDDDTRLHLWSPKWPLTDAPMIHSHSYHFESTVLIGSMHSPEYRVAISDDGDSSLIIGPVTEAALKSPLKCSVEHVRMVTVAAGETYKFGGPERYHVTNSSQLVLTHFRVLPIPASTMSGFVLPKIKSNLTPRPEKPELKAYIEELLEEHNL